MDERASCTQLSTIFAHQHPHRVQRLFPRHTCHLLVVTWCVVLQMYWFLALDTSILPQLYELWRCVCIGKLCNTVGGRWCSYSTASCVPHDSWMFAYCSHISGFKFGFSAVQPVDYIITRKPSAHQHEENCFWTIVILDIGFNRWCDAQHDARAEVNVVTEAFNAAWVDAQVVHGVSRPVCLHYTQVPSCLQIMGRCVLVS